MNSKRRRYGDRMTILLIKMLVAVATLIISGIFSSNFTHSTTEYVYIGKALTYWAITWYMSYSTIVRLIFLITGRYRR